jgi:hypothetical protein
MGMGDRLNNELEDKRTFLRHLIDHRHLEHGRSDDEVAIGITKQVIERGEASLSPNQRRVFKQNVLDVFVTGECKGCGSNILWSEMNPAYQNGGYCARCAYNFNK